MHLKMPSARCQPFCLHLNLDVVAQRACVRPISLWKGLWHTNHKKWPARVQVFPAKDLTLWDSVIHQRISRQCVALNSHFPKPGWFIFGSDKLWLGILSFTYVGYHRQNSWNYQYVHNFNGGLTRLKSEGCLGNCIPYKTMDIITYPFWTKFFRGMWQCHLYKIMQAFSNIPLPSATIWLQNWISFKITHLTNPTLHRHISHNASFCIRNAHTCAHFGYKRVNCGIWDWGIVGFV